MFCKHCGSKVADDAKFCPACGRQITDTDRPEWNTGRSTVNTERSFGNGVDQFQGSSGSRDDAVTAIGGSSLMLAFTIVFSAQILFSLFVGLSVLNVIAIITEIIICVGCWLVYVNSSQRRSGSIGFSVLRIGVPIYMVFSVVENFVFLVAYVRLYYGYPMARLMTIILYLVLIVLVVWCFFGLCRITNSGWKILNGEPAEWKVSSSCYGIMIVLAVLEAITAVVSIVSLPTGAVILTNSLFVVTFILAIAILMSIRKQEQ